MNTATPLVAGLPAAACDSVGADLFGAVLTAPVASLEVAAPVTYPSFLVGVAS